MVLPAPPSRCVGIAAEPGRGSRRLGAGEPQGRAGPGRRLRDPRASSAPRPRRAAPRAGTGGDPAEAAARRSTKLRRTAREGSEGFLTAERSCCPESGRAEAPPPRDAGVTPVRGPRALHGLSPTGLHTCGAGCSTPQRRGCSGGGGGTQVTGSPVAEPPQRPLPVRRCESAHAGLSAPAAASGTGATPRCVCRSLTRTWYGPARSMAGLRAAGRPRRRRGGSGAG